MPWFKIDDSLHSHIKVVRAGNAAMGLWARAGSWSCQHLTDGFIPREVARIYGGVALARKLVEVELWEDAPGGWRMHDFHEYNPSAADIRGDRARRAEIRDSSIRDAVRRRDGDVCRYCGVTVRWADRRGSEGGTYDHVIPDLTDGISNLVVACRGCNSGKRDRTPEQARMILRPAPGSRSDLDQTQTGTESVSVPSRPGPSIGNTTTPNGVVDAPQKRARRKTEASRLDDWMPSPVDVEWARAEGLPDEWVREQTARFCDYWVAVPGAKGRKADWPATWRNWLRRDADKIPARSSTSATSKAVGWLTIDDQPNLRAIDGGSK